MTGPSAERRRRRGRCHAACEWRAETLGPAAAGTAAAVAQGRSSSRLIERFDGREDENLFIVPTGLNLSPMESYPENNAVHPNERGDGVIATTIHAWLVARMQPELPVLQATTLTLDENAPINSLVGRLALQNPLPGRTPQFTISGSPSANAFTIDGTTGELRVADPSALDYETTPVWEVSISVTDPDQPAIHSVTPVRINLRDGNEAPTAIDLQNVTASLQKGTETSQRTKVADLVVDDDFMGVNTLTLSGADASAFEIESSVLYLRAGTVLNAAVQSRYVCAMAQFGLRSLKFQPRANAIPPGASELTDFQVTVSDGVAPAIVNRSTRLATISVNNAPVISGPITGQAVAPHSQIAPFSDLTVADADTQDMFSQLTIINALTQGDFKLDSAVGWNRSVNGNDIVYSRYFIPAANIGSVVQTEIRRLVFQRFSGVSLGNNSTTMLTIFINDGVDNPTDYTASVTANRSG